jgi:hypothetical protein
MGMEVDLPAFGEPLFHEFESIGLGDADAFADVDEGRGWWCGF